MKVIEILELVKTTPLEKMEGLGLGVKKVRAILKEIGAKPTPIGQSGWFYDEVAPENLEKDITEFDEKTMKRREKQAAKTKSNRERSNEVETSSPELIEQSSPEQIGLFSSEEINEIADEVKNIPTKERNRDIMKEPNTSKPKGGKQQVRKRASFDIDNDLLKELKIYAITEEKNVYEIVEKAIKNYLLEAKK